MKCICKELCDLEVLSILLKHLELEPLPTTTAERISNSLRNTPWSYFAVLQNSSCRRLPKKGCRRQLEKGSFSGCVSHSVDTTMRQNTDLFPTDLHPSPHVIYFMEQICSANVCFASSYIVYRYAFISPLLPPLL